MKKLLIILFLLALPLTSNSAVPTTMSYQGKLTDSEGVPLNTSIDLTFTIYDSLTEGSNLWTETQSSVAIVNGILHVELGSVNPLSADTFAPSADRWLGIKVSDDAEMSPRSKLNSIPYALKAAKADTLSTPTIGTLSCASGQVAKSDGAGNWSCGVDIDSGGTVTSITAGSGLNGGTITTSGTISVNTTIIQSRVSGSCSVGNYISSINEDGTVNCSADLTSSYTCNADEFINCYEGPKEQISVGQCRSGIKACEGGAFSDVCTGAVYPTTEIPDNSIDENCDGTYAKTVVSGTPPSGSGSSSVFGKDVAMTPDGNRVVIGDPQNVDSDNIKVGAIYVYDRVGASWVSTQIMASDGQVDDLFGTAVAISSDGLTIAASSIFGDGAETNQGAVYIYKFNGTSWDETKIYTVDGLSSVSFGYEVAMNADGTTVVVSAHNATIEGVFEQGAAYIFKWNGSAWVETRITASDGLASAHFTKWAIDVSSNGDTVVVGDWEDTSILFEQGSVYIYIWNGSSWGETKVTASDGFNWARLGYSVSISGDGLSIIAGSWGADIGTSASEGAGYLFKWNGSTWVETKKFFVSNHETDGIAKNGLGKFAAINSDGTVVALANRYEYGAYVYRYNGSTWDETFIDYPNVDEAIDISGDGSKLVVGGWGSVDFYEWDGSAWVPSL